MNKIKFISISIAILLSILFATTSFDNPSINSLSYDKTHNLEEIEAPSIKLYKAIEKYSDSFNIPKKYAYGMARLETGYKGPFHFRYNHKQTSSVGAVGPMQILPSTARYLNKDNVSTQYLKNNIDYNVMTSMKMLRRLYNTYHDWGKVLGYYNTGYPQPNGYARAILNYKIEWK